MRIGIDARKIEHYGIGTYIKHLIPRLLWIDQKNEYVVFVRPGSTIEGYPVESGSRVKVIEDSSPDYSVRELFSLSRRARAERIDLYHATHYVVPFFLHCPFVVTIHDIIHLRMPEYLPSRTAGYYARWMLHRAVAEAERIIAVSRFTRDDVSSYFDVRKEKFEVIHPGVDHCRGPEDHRDTAPLPRHLRERKYILFVGNPKPHKNVGVLLDAYRRIADRVDVDLVLVGGNHEDLESKIRSLGKSQRDRVHHLEHVSAEVLGTIYRKSEMLVFPSLYEGFGLPPLEAMASGAPVISSNRSCMPEILADAAILIDPEDVGGLSDQILLLLSSEDRVRECVRKGRARARLYTWEAAANRTLKVYEEACSGCRRRNIP